MWELTDMEKKEREVKAKQLLDTYGMNSDCSIDIVLLARNMGFSVLNANLEPDEDGFIIVNENIKKLPNVGTNKVIAVNARRDYEDKRFIIAHEIGHYVFREEKVVFAHRENSHGRSERENDLDYFAACLLMPEEAFKKAFEERKRTSLSILVDYLAAKFEVPYISALRRMEEIGLV